MSVRHRPPPSTAALDADLRAILREEVDLPEHVEIEFKRVMDVVFEM